MKSNNITALIWLSAFFGAGCETIPHESDKTPGTPAAVKMNELPDADPNVYVGHHRDLRYCLDHGASVYLCKVTKRDPSHPNPVDPIERGKVTLFVRKVLRGLKREVLTLPYSFTRTGYDHPTEGFLIWPVLEDGDNNILCVVVPGAHDFSAPTFVGINEAASIVVKMDENPTEFKIIEDTCKEYNENDGK